MMNCVNYVKEQMATKVSKPPKIIFVDGFNTVGKDHFIKALQETLPVRGILTDPRVWLPVFQKDKRYWDFVHRSDEENQAIYHAHLHQLRHMASLIEETMTSDSVLISNRSFVTALIYNFLPSEFEGRSIGGDDGKREAVLRSYRGLFQIAFPQEATLMVNLHQFHDGRYNTRVDNVHQLKKNYQRRENNHQLFNEYYLDYLIHSYQNPKPEVQSLYTYWENCTSSDASTLVQKYFG